MQFIISNSYDRILTKPPHVCPANGVTNLILQAVCKLRVNKERLPALTSNNLEKFRLLFANRCKGILRKKL